MLFVGDDWAEDHHDIAVIDEAGRVLRQGRVPVGVAGIAGFGEILATCVGEDGEVVADQVLVCIEVDSGPWVAALSAAGFRVFGVDPKRAHRHRETLSSSGAKSDKGDALALADMVRTRHHQLPQVGGDSPLSQAIRIVARDHQRAVWERTRHANRLRAALLISHPAILTVCAEYEWDLYSAPILGLLGKAPTAGAAAKLTPRQILPLLTRRHDKVAKAARIAELLRAPQLDQPEQVSAAYAASIRTSAAFLRVANEQIALLEVDVAAHFSQHPDAEIYLSQPGVGPTIGPRLLGEFGDDRARYRTAKARKNAAQTSPLTRQSGKSRIVSARWVGNNWIRDAAMQQASAAIIHDEHARAYYQKQRDRGVEHQAALRQLANRLVGILHGCLAHGKPYNPAIAWAAHTPAAASQSAA